MCWKCEKEKNIEKETHKNVQFYVQWVSRHASQWNPPTDHEVECTLEVKHERHRQCDTNVAYVYEGVILGLGRTVWGQLKEVSQ